jgi:hypothetical protein
LLPFGFGLATTFLAAALAFGFGLAFTAAGLALAAGLGLATGVDFGSG